METDGGLPRTPERDECVKRLFGDAGEANSSEYWSQSSDENVTCHPFTSPPDQVSDQSTIYYI